MGYPIERPYCAGFGQRADAPLEGIEGEIGLLAGARFVRVFFAPLQSTSEQG